MHLPQSVSNPAQAEQSTVLCDQQMNQLNQRAFASMDPVEQLTFLSDMLTTYMRQNTGIQVPLGDFVQLVVQGMERLHKAGRTNVIYLIAKALGTTRPDGSDSLLPTSRMPMGLIEHIVNFFTATSVQQVRQYCLASCIVY